MANSIQNGTMQAVGVIPGRREVALVQHAEPHITQPRHVKFRTLEVGVCGTDKEICSFVYGTPPAGSDYLILGHEALGEVTEVGSGVSTIKPGDLVVPTVRRPCADPHCLPCRRELQDFCTSGDFTERGIKMTHGYLTQYVVEDDHFLTVVPHELRDVAVLVEPLTVAEKAFAQVFELQKRFPWECPIVPDRGRGHCHNAVVLGAGPVGILGAMALVANGFKTYVYSRSKTPNPKAGLVESFGATYISSLEEPVEQLAERVGNIDVVYEALGVANIAFQVLKVLGTNGVFVFTGIPAPNPAIPIEADITMRNLVLKNQLIIGTVNADRPAFQNAIRDLAIFKKRWPGSLKAIITGRFPLSSYRELLLGNRSGIKNIFTLD